MVILLAILLFLILMPPKSSKANNNQPDKLVVKKKQCPPHAWRWQEIVDQNGNKLGERIVCDVCGPLRSSESLKDDV